MNKFLLITLILGLRLFALEIPIQKVELHKFNKSVALNAQVIQLSNAQQSITSLVSGHLEKYYVKPAQKVKQGEKVALIKSIVISKMSAEYIALKKQLNAVNKNYEAIKNLYKKGMTSMQNLNNEEIKINEILAQLNALKSQLETLSINTSTLKKATANFVLYAHSEGIVSKLLKPLHSSISISEPVINIVKNQAYYIQSFVPLQYAMRVKIGDKVIVDYLGKNITSYITQILPKMDKVTQRVLVLSSVNEKVENLFTNSYLKSTLYFAEESSHLAVKKSALSFFNNEWVVFVPNEEEHHEENDKEEHSEHEELPYGVKVVKIITQDEEFVAVDGLELGEKYVSEKAYFVKSLILKGSLGEHGH